LQTLDAGSIAFGSATGGAQRHGETFLKLQPLRQAAGNVAPVSSMKSTG
jgi:hypothetical protein